MRRLPRSPVYASVTGLTLLSVFVFLSRDLPTDRSQLFSGSGQCSSCHSAGSGALIGPDGSDISPSSLWRSTVMANAAKDPLWIAKVSTEVAENPELQATIEDKCTTCHAPAGRTEAVYHGASGYSMAEMAADPLARDGITCTVCHQIEDIGLGSDSTYSGGFVITEDKLIYGPYEAPMAGPMTAASGFRPEYAPHILESELCATCHTLFTPFLDNDGQIAGTFPEQTAYFEWLNSDFVNEEISCQDCHMPRIEDPVVISSVPPTAPPRSPFAKHNFVGGNLTMLNLIRANIDSIGATAEEIHFDSTIARTARQLQEATVALSAEATYDADSLVLTVKVENLAGHKFPTGFPSRRAWLHVKVSDGVGNTVFESGRWDDEAGSIAGDTDFQPHYETIRDQSHTQIYQSVMVDVDGELTWILLRGADYRKDNRIPPRGFQSTHDDYEFMAVRGAAEVDPDFNHEVDTEGSGSDIVRYKLSELTEGSQFTAEISLIYQSTSPTFIEDLLTYETAEVNEFQRLWSESTHDPIVMKTVVLQSSTTGTAEETLPNALELSAAFPNPFVDDVSIQFQMKEPGFAVVEVFDVAGRRIRRLVDGVQSTGIHTIRWDGLDRTGHSVPSGLYFATLSGPDGSVSMPITRLSR